MKEVQEEDWWERKTRIWKNRLLWIMFLINLVLGITSFSIFVVGSLLFLGTAFIMFDYIWKTRKEGKQL